MQVCGDRPRTGRGSNSSLVRHINARRVLDLLRGNSPLTRADIARLTGLAQLTCLSILGDLERQGFVVRVGTGPSRGGRRPLLFAFNHRASYVLGLDISQREIRALLLDLDGNLIECRNEGFPRASNPPAVLDATIHAAQRLVARAKQDGTLVLGVGLSLPGLVNPQTGVAVYSALLGWQDVAVATPLAQALGLPVAVENNVRALALAESCFGAGRGAASLVCVDVGAGIGASIVLEGRVYRGAQDAAGEIGHVSVTDDGPRCACGNYGCLEALASGAALVQHLARSIKQGASTRVLDLAGSPEDITISHICRAAQEGDLLALAAINEAGRYLGIAIAIIANLLNPQLVVVHGEITNAGDLFLQPVREAAARRSLRGAACCPRIVPGRFGPLSAAIGAAALALQQANLSIPSSWRESRWAAVDAPGCSRS